MILPASSLAEGCAALEAAGCPQIRLFPLWPKAGRAAKLIIMCGVRGGGGAASVLPGLVLHQENGRFTDEAEIVLRGGGGLMSADGARGGGSSAG